MTRHDDTNDVVELPVDATTRLCDRVADCEASTDEWHRFSHLADQAPGLWRELAITQREAALLGRAVHEAIEDVDDLELDDVPPAVVGRIGTSSRWSGWAVAALLALAWVTGLGGVLSSPDRGSSPPVNAASLLGSPNEALQAYIEEGQRSNLVVGEVPEKVIVNFWPAESGEGYHVFYLRQILEHRTVPELYEFAGQDEAGRAVPVRFEPRRRSSM